MIIENVRLIDRGTRFRVSADCSTDSGVVSEVYFEFDSKYRTHARKSATPFAAALLLPSMRLGEDLVIKGMISEKMLNGMHQIMNIVSEWNINLRPIKVIADSVVSEVSSGGTDIVTTFSGGVDSFYTWLHHKADETPVKSMLFVHGFDISLDNRELYDRTVSNIKNIASEEQASFIEAESNIRSFIDPILDWGFSHGGCLVATALCLSGTIKTMYIPSSYTIDEEHPWGSHRLVDGLWSTESTSFVHDGYETTRVGKVVEEVGKSETALKYLRVCWKEVDGEYNCGRCNKCLRTMVNLYVAGALDQSKTFPHEIDLGQIARAIIDEADTMFVKENIDALKALGRGDEIIAAYEKSLRRTKRRLILRKIKASILVR